MSKESIDLIEYMSTTIEIECQGRSCDVSDTAWNEDDVDFAKELWKKGWRISRQGTLYCPNCVKKNKLKNKTP